MNKVLGGVIAVPATLIVTSSVAGATAQMTGANRAAVAHSLRVTSAAIMISATLTGNPSAIVGTAVAIGAVWYATQSAWPWNGDGE